MIHDIRLASTLNNALVKASEDLNEALLQIVDSLSRDERDVVQMAMARILGEILLEGLNPLHDEHPKLKPLALRGLDRLSPDE